MNRRSYRYYIGFIVGLILGYNRVDIMKRDWLEYKGT